jgi:hypothetical protein
LLWLIFLFEFVLIVDIFMPVVYSAKLTTLS